MKSVFFLVKLLSKLPLPLLYLFSNCIALVFKYLFNYRKDVIEQNLKNSFPEKKIHEIILLRQQFYSYFADYIIEMAKLFSASPEYINRRVEHKGIEIFHKAKKEKKNIILLTGHIFNWEWFTPLATIIPQEKCFPVYRNLQSDFWRDKIKAVRSRFGNEALEATEVLKHILRNSNDGNSAYMFVADQSPNLPDVRYGLKFLHQDTPAYIGYDKLATRADFIFIYCDMKKIGRGKYSVHYQEIIPDGEKFLPYEIVKKFHSLLEKSIQKAPANYLWSHRKWKYQHAIRQMDSQNISIL